MIIVTAYSVPESYSWDELHITAQRDSIEFVDLVHDYYHNFPCEMCRAHFQNMTDTMEEFLPLDKISSRREAQIWGWLAHNSVNLRLGREWFPLSRIKLKLFRKSELRKQQNQLNPI